MMDNAVLWTLLGLFLVFDGVVFLAWWYHQRAQARTTTLKAAQDALIKRVDALDRQLALVGQAIMPISTAFQAILIKELTHFHTPRMDALLAKLGPPYTLTEAEEEELLAALKERERDMGDLITDSERDAAHIFPAVMRRAKAEAAALAEMPMTLRLVTVAATALHDRDQQALIHTILSGPPPSESRERERPSHG